MVVVVVPLLICWCLLGRATKALVFLTSHQGGEKPVTDAHLKSKSNDTRKSSLIFNQLRGALRVDCSWSCSADIQYLLGIIERCKHLSSNSNSLP